MAEAEAEERLEGSRVNMPGRSGTLWQGIGYSRDNDTILRPSGGQLFSSVSAAR